jgi:uncharacterized protein YeeX (DUF496 family)
MPYKDRNSPEAKESTRKADARYLEKNRDKKREYQKLRYQKDKEKIKSYQRDYYKNAKDGKWRVYLLPNIMYVGQTGMSIIQRMYRHKDYNNDTTDYMVLHVCDTKQEALQLEKIYHDIGFKGMNPTRR